VGSTQGARSPRRDVRDWDIRNLRIETHWLSSGRHHAAKSRRLFFNFVTTTPWRVARRVCHRQAKESYDEEPSAWLSVVCDPAYLARPSRTWRDGRAVDRFAVSRGGRLECPAKFPNSNRPTPRVPERQATGLETAQRTSTATPADISGSHVTIAARSSLGSAGASRTSRTRVHPEKLRTEKTEIGSSRF